MRDIETKEHIDLHPYTSSMHDLPEYNAHCQSTHIISQGACLTVNKECPCSFDSVIFFSENVAISVDVAGHFFNIYSTYF